MKVHPVRVTTKISDETTSTFVHPFSNMSEAKSFRTKESKKSDCLKAELLPSQDFDISGKGILKAFTKGQDLSVAF